MPTLDTVPLLFKSLFQLRQLLLVLDDILWHKPSLPFPIKTGLILKQSLLSLRHSEKLPDVFGINVLGHLLDMPSRPVFDGRTVHGFGDGVGAVDLEHF
jgi:hypothetical protein